MGKRIPYIKSILTDFEYTDIEFSELYFRLPIGYYLPNGEIITEFSLNRFTGHNELRLGELEDQWGYLREKNHLEYIVRLFTDFLIDSKSPLATLNGHSLQEMAEKAELPLKKLIEQFYFADILYILLSIRRSVFGDEVSLQGTCPCEKAAKIVNPCSINTIVFRCWQKKEPPEFTFKLPSPLLLNGEEKTSLTLSPLRFEQISSFDATVREVIRYDRWFLTQAIPNFTEDNFWSLPCRIQEDLEDAAMDVASFGPDRVLSELGCLKCGYEGLPGHTWDVTLPYGVEHGYESFYAFLLHAPRQDEQKVSDSLIDQAFFLTFGDQAPFKGGIDVVYDLTPAERMRWIEKTSETYEKQQQDIKNNK